MRDPHRSTPWQAQALFLLLLLAVAAIGLARLREPSVAPPGYEIVAACSPRGACPLSASPLRAPSEPGSTETTHR